MAFYLISQLRYMRTYYLIIDIFPDSPERCARMIILRNFAFIVTSENDSVGMNLYLYIHSIFCEIVNADISGK